MPLAQSDMAQFALATQIAGLGVGTFGAILSGIDQRSSLRSQAAMAALNAEQYEKAAQAQLNAGNVQASQVSARAGQIKSSQRASMAANGIDVGQGSAAEVQASTDIQKEIDMNQIQSNAIAHAFGYRIHETDFQNEAIMKKGQADGVSPVANGLTTLIGGAGGVAKSWYQMDKNGLLDGSIFKLGKEEEIKPTIWGTQ
jgi:hypothetical protein